MKRDRDNSPTKSSPEAGYALLMIIFSVATLLLFAAMATPNVLTQGRREKEQEAIWRGNQYVRAIQLYYRKYGRYPPTLEDLTKADAAGVHFLRKSYADPMNFEDGSWRMIYVSPAGQLIGSVRYRSLQEMALTLGLNMPTGNNLGPNGLPLPPAQTNAAPANQGPGQPEQPGQPAQPGQLPNQSSEQPAPLAPPEPVSGPILGGSLIGVAGKAKRPSLLVYQGGKTYYEWEFIWNPLTTVNLVVPPLSGAQPAPTGNVPANPSGFSMTPTQPPATSPAP